MNKFFAILLAVALVSSVEGYVTRLYFRNNTKGTSNAGALLCDPGDSVTLVFEFQMEGDRDKWGSFQMLIPLPSDPIVSEAELATFVTQAQNAFLPDSQYPIQIMAGPEAGPLFDNSTDPTDRLSMGIAPRGLYLMIAKRDFWSAKVDFFSFHIRNDIQQGEMSFALKGTKSGFGLGTRLIDSHNVIVDFADNYIQVGLAHPKIVTGHISFSSLQPGAPRPPTVLIEIRQLGSNWFKETTVTADGAYSLTIEDAPATLVLRRQPWLSAVRQVDPSIGQNTADFDLVNGDAVWDDRIDVTDLIQTLLYFGTSTPPTDLDGDGVVGLSDITIVLINFGMKGEDVYPQRWATRDPQ